MPPAQHGRCIIGLNAWNAVTDFHYHTSEVSEPDAEFHGIGSRMMGLSGRFEPEWHDRLLHGLNPHTGERLAGMRNVANRQGGWDLTFNQDKGISLVELIAQDERISDVRIGAIHEAMAVFESQIRVSVRKSDQMGADNPKGYKYPERISGNVPWALFNHSQCREGSPNAHGHVVVYNASWDAVERQWKTAQTKWVNIGQVNDTYHASFAKGLRKLGYDATWDGKTLTMKGIDQELKDQFSPRHTAIKELEKEFDARAEAKKHKPMPAKERAKLALYNRPEKQYVPIKIRRGHWMSRITKSQFANLSSVFRKAKASVARLKTRLMTQRHLSRDAYSPEVTHDRSVGRER
jgi:conjugative relaxase-like TrwC/TraI family protein